MHAAVLTAMPVTPVESAYQRLIGGFAAAIMIYLVTGRTIRMRASPVSAGAPFPASPLPAPVWVSPNALFGPILGVTCLMWAVSLVHNPGLVQTVAAIATLLSILPARLFEAARPGLSYYLGCCLALAGVAMEELGLKISSNDHALRLIYTHNYCRGRDNNCERELKCGFSKNAMLIQKIGLIVSREKEIH